VRDTHPAMSEESTTPDPVELTRSLSEAVNRCDLDAAMSFYAPDAVWESPPLGSRFEGLPAIRGFHEDWLSAYDEFWAEPEEILDLGYGVMVTVVGQDGRPAGSTGHVQTRMAVISEWVGGKIVRVIVYHDIAEGRAAAERLAEERG
jgi:ketosteroid isomerase-like protein